MLRKPALLALAVIFSALMQSGCVERAGTLPQATTMDAPLRTISPAEPLWTYEGRFDFADATRPVVVWQGSRIRLGFEGTTLALTFENISGQSFFDLEIDGKQSLVSIRDPGVQRLVVARGLKSGRHEFTLFKRSEAAAGYVRFLGAEVSHGAGVFLVERNPGAVKFQFFGDSITVGACNEDPGDDQWEDRSTHNNAQSYGAMTARAFKADYRNIAVSGMGVCEGYVEVRAIEMWDRIYPTAKSPAADLTTWQPDVLFINLGENDDSYSKNQGHGFPSGFTERYVSLVREIRKHFTGSRIVLLRGGMGGGAKSEALEKAWTLAVNELEKSDSGINHFVFKHWSGPHPRVADDRAMADELISWLKQQPPAFFGRS